MSKQRTSEKNGIMRFSNLRKYDEKIKQFIEKKVTNTTVEIPNIDIINDLSVTDDNKLAFKGLPIANNLSANDFPLVDDAEMDSLFSDDSSEE